MEIKQVVKTPEGKITFNCTVSQEELDVIVNAGLASLITEGYIAIHGLDDTEGMTPQ